MKVVAALGLLVSSAVYAQTAAGDADAAVRQLESILRSDPPPAAAGQARLDLLRIYRKRGDSWKMAEQLHELRRLAPRDPEYAYQLGAVYQNLSRWASERLEALAPAGARTQLLLGEQYTVAGERDKAIAAFRKAAAADPKMQGSHLALAVIYMQMAKHAEALSEIDQELAIAPESAAASHVRQSIQRSTR